MGEQGPEEVGCCQLCCLLCAILCPPTPSHIARKMAFHPPLRNEYYRLILENDEIAKSAKDCFNRPYRMEYKIVKGENQWNLLNEKYVQPFVLKVSRKIYISCVKCKPVKYSPCEKIQQQVVIFCQPNSSDIGGYLNPIAGRLLTITDILAVDLYTFDYPGFGYSTGTQSEKRCYSALQTLYDYVREENPDKYIVLIGFSIGTAISTHIAHLRPDRLVGLILIAPFASGMRLYTNNPTRQERYCLDAFRSLDKAPYIDVPTLVIHGTNDETIPIEHGMAIVSSLGDNAVAPLYVYGANHSNVFTPDHFSTMARIVKFMHKETKVPSGNSATTTNTITASSIT